MKVCFRWPWTFCVGIALAALPLTSTAADNSIALEALSRLKGIDLETNPAVKNAVLKVLAQVRGTPQFVEIVRDFKLSGQEPALLEFAAKDPSSSAAADAMRLVLHGDQPALLPNALAGTNAPALAEALGNTGEKEIVPLLLPLLTNSVATNLPAQRQALLSLCKVQEGAAAVLKLANDQQLPPMLRLLASSELNFVRWPEIKAEASQVLPLPQTRNALPLPPLTELLKLKGDPAKGAALFRKETIGCFKCHQVNGEGTDFGPALSEIGTKLGKDALYESILDPSAGISFGYEAWQLNLKNGEEAYGLISSETADEISLKTLGGIITRYKKSDVLSRVKQKLSIMPAGLQQAMSTQDLVDLVEYLSTLRKTTTPAK